jgi:DNA-binding transcriptional regulator YdaS (Cro superfamily)
MERIADALDVAARTRETMPTSGKSALQVAISKCGSQEALGRTIGRSQQIISYWVKTEKLLPAEHVFAVEAATGLSRKFLRPDLFGEVHG